MTATTPGGRPGRHRVPLSAGARGLLVAALALGVPLLPADVHAATPSPAPHRTTAHPRTPRAIHVFPTPQTSRTKARTARPAASRTPAGAAGAPAAIPPAAATPPQAGAAASRDDGGREAALVDQEDERIIQIRAVLSSLMQAGGKEALTWKQPQIFGSAHGKTLVLPQRTDDSAYTLTDLARYGGRYFRRLRDGSYLLSAHVFVADGAKLTLQSNGRPLTIRMGSVPGSFSSIVGFGGTITVTGTAQAPVRIMSWDARTRRPDTQVNDGRAYLRAIGGAFRMTYAQVSDLGFWSGRTGGIALTGTERPANAARHLNKDQRHEAKRRRLAGKKNETGAVGPGDVEVAPAGPGGTASHVPAAGLVTGAVKHSRITGDAYGIFVSGSTQTQIIDDRVENSLAHGVLLHRYTKDASVQNTTVSGSGGDGFVLSRATEGVRITGSTSERNHGNGFTLNGRPLAVGPSASGESPQAYGNSSVNGSTARDNGHYGIEVLGGNRLAVQTSKVIGSDMGIVVRSAATDVQISGNQLSGQRRQGIALREKVTGAQVAGNLVNGVQVGIYLRDSSGKLSGNIVRGATEHGIVLRGGTGGTHVVSNTLRGSGPSAISKAGSHGALTRENNDTSGWDDTSGLLTKAMRYAKPMNVIWAAVFLIVVFMMVRSRALPRRNRRGIDPYAAQRRLAERPARALRGLTAGGDGR
ncbi:right-handed parallel beta-helix repeat-containing protein [Actinoallomurus spadix]|uniref:Right handed beta helix domain-containing protein n=1 Tax=Actinoallomurus spadix TaxID=79912 RepID=A0ABN0XK94_9ACTN|nr:right-handed parallel beta-helix repeat-containing protein [Actinoallomurus spadix]MCO5985004.1 right-handed parallel beta-helix repeat-containing protein [Actinoallomurus spadix]